MNGTSSRSSGLRLRGCRRTHAIQAIKGAQVWHAAGRFRLTRVAQRPCSGKSEQVQSEMHGGKVAGVLPQVVAVHRGKL